MNNELVILAFLTMTFGAIILIALIPNWVYRAFGIILLWIIALTMTFVPMIYLITLVDYPTF